MSTLTALYAGEVCRLEPEGQRTGIYKHTIESATVSTLGIVGDHQADKRHHGGHEKALHQYATSAYPLIRAKYPRLADTAIPGSLGENLSSPDLSDAEVCIGDVYRLGAVLVQVSQPRRPCWKINHKFGVDDLSMFIEHARITGWYYRVIEPGKLSVGEEIELIDRPNEGISIAHFTAITKQHRPRADDLAQLIGCGGLNQQWKRRLEERAKYLARKRTMRLA